MKSKLLIAATVATITVPAAGIALAQESLPLPSSPSDRVTHTAAWRHDHHRLLGMNVRLTRRLSGDKAARHARHERSDWSNRHLSRANARLRRQLRAHRASQARQASIAVPAILQRIAQCESGGNPHAVDPSGTYRGKYQFDYQTWQANGGTGDPAAAPEAEQDRIALRLYQQRGASPWPVCGR